MREHYVEEGILWLTLVAHVYVHAMSFSPGRAKPEIIAYSSRISIHGWNIFT